MLMENGLMFCFPVSPPIIFTNVMENLESPVNVDPCTFRLIQELTHALAFWIGDNETVDHDTLSRGERWLKGKPDPYYLDYQYHKPVQATEHPWEHSWWCDNRGKCWVFFPGVLDGWMLMDAATVAPNALLLPYMAIPDPNLR